jgi:hypothetical protein
MQPDWLTGILPHCKMMNTRKSVCTLQLTCHNVTLSRYNACLSSICTYYYIILKKYADPSGNAVEDVGMQPLACWNFGFETRRWRESLSVLSVLCCQLEVSASGWSFVQRSTTEWGVSARDREACIMRRRWPFRGCRGAWEKQCTGVCITTVMKCGWIYSLNKKY